MKRLITLYEHYSGEQPQTCQPIAGSGSNRQYFRLTSAGGKSVVGVIGTDVAENNAFVYLSKEFQKRGLPVPEVLAIDAAELCYLQTDLGNRSLYDALKEGREANGDYNPKERELLRRTIAMLPAFQILGGRGLDFNRCYPQAEMDRRNVLFDLNYFKYCFLMPSGTEFHEVRLEEEFQRLADDLTSEQSLYFMYRDFQARNIMLDENDQPHFIDFQGGRRGPLQYDVASFLWQASARYPEGLRAELIDAYLQSLRKHVDVDEVVFLRRLPLYVLFRTLQVLGAYGFRGYFERKQYFLDSIPPALQNLRNLLAQVACAYPYLHSVLTRLVSTQKDSQRSCFPCMTCSTYGTAQLTIRVLSFSYKQGIPCDETGNGGGYVFDCRAIHNPGKYDEYKNLTGLDKPVIDFLEWDGEITTFLRSVCQLADAHVTRYMQRGFTDLMFAFGCTGGQHRSVYSAQHLAEHLNYKFGIEVHITHTARGIHTILPSRGRTAMVFAAGLGTRLKPLTDTMPKALVPVAGRPLIEHVVEKLRRNGFSRIIVNAHHFADMIQQWARDKTDVVVSDERDKLLDTGGGIRHAVPLFGQADRILLHNVDILSNADLNAFWAAGEEAEATMLVSERQTNRYLLFADDMRLVGWTNVSTGEVKSPYPDLDVSSCRKLAFAGIHQIKASLFQEMQSLPDVFSIIDFYLRNCHKHTVKGYIQPDLRLLDVGKTDTLSQASSFLSLINT